MTVRIEFPFDAQFEFQDPGNNSRELRTQFLHTYLLNSGMELGKDVEEFYVSQFNGSDNGEFWTVKAR
jgi:hypothetical protein